MKNNFNFIKDMIIGGILFFIPLMIFILVLQKAIQIATVLVSPIIKLLDVTKIFGIGVEIFISIISILFVFYLGGLIAKNPKVKSAVVKLEESIFSNIPGYDILKKTGENFAVYIPGIPSPLSGSLYFLEKNRIKKTNISMKDAMKCMRGLGKGSNDLVKNYL